MSISKKYEYLRRVSSHNQIRIKITIAIRIKSRSVQINTQTMPQACFAIRIISESTLYQAWVTCYAIFAIPIRNLSGYTALLFNHYYENPTVLQSHEIPAHYGGCLIGWVAKLLTWIDPHELYQAILCFMFISALAMLCFMYFAPAIGYTMLYLY